MEEKKSSNEIILLGGEMGFSSRAIANKNNQEIVKTIILDPEGEYSKLAEILGGEVITINANSNSKFNPFEIKNDYELNLDKLKIKERFTIEKCIRKLNTLSSKCSNLELSEDREEVIYLDVETEAAKCFYYEIFEGITFEEYVKLFDVISEDFTDIAPLFHKINDTSKGYTICVNEEDRKFKCEMKDTVITHSVSDFLSTPDNTK